MHNNGNPSSALQPHLDLPSNSPA